MNAIQVSASSALSPCATVAVTLSAESASAKWMKAERAKALAASTLPPANTPGQIGLRPPREGHTAFASVIPKKTSNGTEAASTKAARFWRFWCAW